MAKAMDEAAEKVVDEDIDETPERVVSATSGGETAQYQWSWIRNTFTIARRELRAYFDSLVAYAVIGLGMAIVGAHFFLVQGGFWQANRATMGRMFEFMPMYVLPVACALITMRTLAEEKRMGTLELLITLPVRDSEVIMGKYFGALGLICIFLLASLIYPIAMFVWPWHLGALDWGPVFAGYFGLVLWAGAGVAIGMLYSSLTDSQIIAFFLTLVTLAVFVAMGSAVEALKGLSGDVLAFLSFQTRYAGFAKGLIDTRAVLYFLSVAILALLVAFRNLESRKWS